MIELSEDQSWEIEVADGVNEVLSTFEVFKRLRDGQLNGRCRCRLLKSEWYIIDAVFRLLGGKYGLLKPLGEGAFAKVYMALDIKHRSPVAIKIPLGNDLDRRRLTEIFMGEAMHAARLEMASYVVKVLDFDPHEPYIVLLYCDQGSLADRMKAPYTADDVLRWAHEIALALSAAHGLSPSYLVHHDLKPPNVLFADGTLMLSDFGGAMFIRDSALMKSVKPFGLTPLYAAPETFDLKVDYPHLSRAVREPRAMDVWSLGVILWELLSGELPFDDDSFRGLIRKIQNTPPNASIPIRAELNHSVPAALVALVYRCLKKEPEGRPTAQECGNALANLRGEAVITQENWTPVVPLEEWVRHHGDYLYKTSRVVLRENLQNAIDAVRMSGRSSKQRKVDVSFDTANKQLMISDNGIGMTLQEQRDSFWKPYGSTKRRLSPAERMKQGVIGQFGIGAYASFKLARKVTVVSKSATTPHSLPSGTSVDLEKPLNQLGPDEPPKLRFRVLNEVEATAAWRSKDESGTSIIIQLHSPIELEEADKWITEASAFLEEQISFQGKIVNDRPNQLQTLEGAAYKEVVINIADRIRNPDYNEGEAIEKIRVRVALEGVDDPKIEICAVKFCGAKSELQCRGVLILSREENSKGLSVLKHRFLFKHINDTKEFVSADQSSSQWGYLFESLSFDGQIDLPFVDPDPPREGFSGKSTSQMCAILTGISIAVVDQVALNWVSALDRFDQLFRLISSQGLQRRRELLNQYPFKIVGKSERQTLDSLIKRKSGEEGLRVSYLSDRADQKTRQMARTLSLLEDYCIIQLDGPFYWRGYCLSRIVEELLGASNLSGARTFVSIIPDQELGSWGEYRAKFASALANVIGPGRQLLVARIEPADIVMVVPDGAGIVYVNYNNSHVRALPESGLVGPNLESVIRSWAFGRVAAEVMEEELMRQGKLLVVQKITELVVVANRGSYIPQSDDQLLLLRDGNSESYLLRIPSLLEMNVSSVVDQSGKLRRNYLARLNWVGNMFYLIFPSTDVDIPTVLFGFNTSLILRNPEKDGALEGSTDFQLRIEEFCGPGLDGAARFIFVPRWIGDLLNLQRTKMGAVQIGVFSQLISKTLDGSAEPTWWTWLWSRVGGRKKQSPQMRGEG